MEDFELLVQEVHRRGLKIILDIALNHTASTVCLPATVHLEKHIWLMVHFCSMNGFKHRGELAKTLVLESEIGISGVPEN